MLGIPSTFYMIRTEYNQFISADIRNLKLANYDCYSLERTFQWKTTQNIDGSFKITTLHDTAIRLVYQIYTGARLPNITHPANELALLRTNDDPYGLQIFDKFYFKLITNNEYKLFYNDKKDSTIVKLIIDASLY